MPDVARRPAVTPSVFYRDAMAAFEWLQTAFGLEPAMLLTNPDGTLAHSELVYGDGWIMVGTEWSDEHKSPSSIGGRNTQTVHIDLNEDLDAHCERARAAGAEIIAEPADQFYGDRTYRAKDLEGHIWTFARTARETTPEEWERTTGLRTKLWE